MPTEEMLYPTLGNLGTLTLGDRLDFDSSTDVDTISEYIADELGYTNTATYPSAPATAIDLPEISDVTSEFFYNYYTKDERTVSTGTATIVDVASAGADIDFVKGKSRMPRSVILKIKVPAAPELKNESSAGAFLQQYVIDKGPGLLEMSPADLIVFEGALANTRFSSIILQDNQTDETFYNQLTGSVAFTDAYNKTDTNSEFVNSLNAMWVSPMAQATATPSTLRRVLSNYQPAGIAYAASDARVEQITEALRDVRRVEFNFTINNSVISNMVLGALEDRGNIYQDELLSIQERASDIQDYYVLSSSPSVIDSSDFELEMAPVFTLVQTPTENNFADEESYPIGLYIEKTEINFDSDGNQNFTKCDPIIINSYGNFNIFESDIKYGATYLYKVRIIFLTMYEATAIDEDGATPDETIFGISMIASQGVQTQVAAVENIPPPPPQNLRFNYNFESRCLDIFWEEPTNPQRDVMRYQIFRRRSIHESFVLLAEFDFDMSTSRVTPLEIAPKEKSIRMRTPSKYYKDRSFKKEQKYIYALASVDARGLTSGYSEQIEVKFNRLKNMIERNRISPPKAPKAYPNL